jgi:adenosylcobinamide-GDP ribazoletransferase
VTGRPWAARVAVSMFTILPVRVDAEVDAALASRAVRWLPAVGLLLSVPAAAVLLAAGGGTGVIAGITVSAGAGGLAGSTVLHRLLGAVLALTVLGVLTGGLHLDGLADTTDGLASRRPPSEALDIMRRGDTGPLGVAALVFAVLLQVAALAALPWRLAAVGLVLGAVTARVAVLLATGPGFPAARPGGFGALVAGRTPAPACLAAAALLLAAAGGAGGLAGGVPLAVALLTAAAAGLASGAGVAAGARSKLGGVTGDVFGAVVEVSMTVTLVALALVA